MLCHPIAQNFFSLMEMPMSILYLFPVYMHSFILNAGFFFIYKGSIYGQETEVPQTDRMTEKLLSCS